MFVLPKVARRMNHYVQYVVNTEYSMIFCKVMDKNLLSLTGLDTRTACSDVDTVITYVLVSLCINCVIRRILKGRVTHKPHVHDCTPSAPK